MICLDIPASMHCAYADIRWDSVLKLFFVSSAPPKDRFQTRHTTNQLLTFHVINQEKTMALDCMRKSVP